jgi:UPF0755 protein
MEEKKSRLFRNVILAVLLVALFIGSFSVYEAYLKPNVPGKLRSEFVHIPTGSALEDVVKLLTDSSFIKDPHSFRLLAQQMKYKGRAGRFEIKPSWSNYSLIKHLRSGQQAPVKLVLHNERLPENIAAKVARFLEPDSLSIITLLNDPIFIDSIGYTPQTLTALFIPNTYEMFWNTSPRKFMERMISENERFWEKDNRQAKADALNLSREQVYIVASIVEKETNQNEEKQRVAGVYLNRLSINMPLQADPTLVFASRDWDTRDIAQYKSLDSPYNTYKYPGLPPGPICMASIPSIDAVLNAEEHNFIFFCAIGDGSGLHSFAETYDAHLVNVARYRKNLIDRGLGL